MLPSGVLRFLTDISGAPAAKNWKWGLVPASLRDRPLLAAPALPVGLHVLLAVEGSLEGLLAVGAHVGSQVIVNAHVTPQAAARSEGAIADETFEGLEARVCAHMCLENSSGHKSSATLGTLKRLLPSVGPANGTEGRRN